MKPIVTLTQQLQIPVHFRRSANGEASWVVQQVHLDASSLIAVVFHKQSHAQFRMLVAKVSWGKITPCRLCHLPRTFFLTVFWPIICRGSFIREQSRVAIYVTEISSNSNNLTRFDKSTTSRWRESTSKNHNLALMRWFGISIQNSRSLHLVRSSTQPLTCWKSFHESSFHSYSAHTHEKEAA